MLQRSIVVERVLRISAMSELTYIVLHVMYICVQKMIVIVNIIMNKHVGHAMQSLLNNSQQSQYAIVAKFSVPNSDSRLQRVNCLPYIVVLVLAQHCFLCCWNMLR